MRKSKTISAEIEKIGQRLQELQATVDAATEKLEASRLEFVAGRLSYDDYKAVGAEQLDVTQSVNVLTDARKVLEDELARALAAEHDASQIVAVRQAVNRNAETHSDYLLARQQFEEAARNLVAAKTATVDSVNAVRSAAQVIVPDFVTPRNVTKHSREQVERFLTDLGPELSQKLHKVFEPETPVSEFEAAIGSAQFVGEAAAYHARRKKQEEESRARRGAAAIVTKAAEEKRLEERKELAQRQNRGLRKWSSGSRNEGRIGI